MIEDLRAVHSINDVNVCSRRIMFEAEQRELKHASINSLSSILTWLSPLCRPISPGQRYWTYHRNQLLTLMVFDT